MIHEERIARLEPPAGRVRVVLDTDTYNQIDDQFAVAYALHSPEKLAVEALYAAPFFRERSNSPGDGMEKSYREILRLLERMDISPAGLVYRGSTAFLLDERRPPQSDAVVDLIERARRPAEGPLYMVAIAALTNAAAAICQAPDIIEHLVVVWLGGHGLDRADNDEFNLRQDLTAARLILDCGVPLVHIPCRGGAHTLEIGLPEIADRVKGRGAIGDYLYDLFAAFVEGSVVQEKVIWDIAPIAWLINAAWVPTELIPSPVLNQDKTWGADPARHLIRSAREVQRDAIFEDLFVKLEGQKLF